MHLGGGISEVLIVVQETHTILVRYTGGETDIMVVQWECLRQGVIHSWHLGEEEDTMEDGCSPR